MKKVAVILSGCGYLDGAEIRESVLALLALDMEGTEYSIFAPNKEQTFVENHLAGGPKEGETRNILEEAARIARGKVTELSQLNVSEFDALVMPGGFGLVVNLSTFGTEGPAGSVDDELARIVKEFHSAFKPIGAICITPAIMAMVLGEHNPTLTIGDDENLSGALESLGAKHVVCPTNDCVIDEKNKIVSSPAYIDDSSTLSDVNAGIAKCVKEVLKLA